MKKYLMPCLLVASAVTLAACNKQAETTTEEETKPSYSADIQGYTSEKESLFGGKWDNFDGTGYQDLYWFKPDLEISGTYDDAQAGVILALAKDLLQSGYYPQTIGFKTYKPKYEAVWVPTFNLTILADGLSSAVLTVFPGNEEAEYFIKEEIGKDNTLPCIVDGKYYSGSENYMFVAEVPAVDANNMQLGIDTIKALEERVGITGNAELLKSVVFE